MSQTELTTQLFEACENGDVEQVRRLVALGGDPCFILSEHAEAITSLHLVCKLGNLKVLKLLVEICSQIDFEVRNGQKGLTPFHYACLYGHRDICMYLIDHKCDPHTVTNNGNTALHMACRCLYESGLEIMKYLVQVAKCNVNVRNQNGNTPLLLLLNQNRKDKALCMLRYLIIDCACDTSLTNNDGNTALHLACISGCTVSVKLILEADSHLQAKQNTYSPELQALAIKGLRGDHCLYVANKIGEIPIEIAMKSKVAGNELVPLLIKAMYNRPDENGNSPLHLACLNANIPLAEIIAGMIISGLHCDPDVANSDGDTPLHLACRFGNVYLAELILDMNCNVNVENKEGDTPLTIACKGKYYLLLKLFRENEMRIRSGEKSFFTVCKVGNIEMASLLLQLKWDANELSSGGIAPIQIAFQNGHVEIVEQIIKNFGAQAFTSSIMWLLERGYNPASILKQIKSCNSLLNVVCGTLGDLYAVILLRGTLNFDEVDEMGWTALHYACDFGHIAIVKYLINEQLCSPLAKDTQKQQTSLHRACTASCENQQNALEIVMFLTTNTHADCNAQSITGDSPLMLLIRTKDTWNDIAHYLIHQCKCNLSLKNLLGETALHIACTRGNVNVVRMIIDQGFDPIIKDNVGNIPVHIAFRNGQSEIVTEILKSSYYGVATTLVLLKLFGRPQEIVSKHNIVCQKQDRDGNSIMHMICISNDNPELAKMMVDMGCRPNLVNNDGDTALHIVCRNGNIDMAISLLSSDECGINLQNKDGNTPLHIACRKGHAALVEILVKKNPNMTLLNAQGRSAVYEAFHTNVKLGWLVNTRCTITDEQVSLCGKCDLPMLNQLLDADVHPSLLFQEVFSNARNIFHIVSGQLGDFNALKFLSELQDASCYVMTKDCNGWTALHHACSYGLPDIVSYLVNKYDSLLTLQTNDGKTPLHVSFNPCSTEEKTLSMVKILTANSKCDCNVRDNDGNTPIMHLVCNRPFLTTVIQYLVEECLCDLSLTNHNGDTVFHLACGNVPVNSETLIKNCGDPCSKNNEGNTALHLACRYGHEQIVKSLIHQPNNGLYVQNAEFLTPLEVAEEHCKFKMVSLLIYAMYDSIDDNRSTPLHIACQARNVSLAKKILDMNFNVTSADKYGDTPLHLACREGSIQLVKLLIEHDGCDFDYQNVSGDTPLHAACESRNQVVVNIVLNKCQFPHRKNNAGLSPFQVALQNNNLEIAYILLENKEAVQVLATHFMQDTADINGWTPLHYACYYGHSDIVADLVNDLGSNPNAKTLNGISPLQLACHSDCSDEIVLKIATFLITVAKCDPDALIYSGDTLLIHLLKTNNCRHNVMMYLILEYRCGLLIADSDGNTALHIACSLTLDPTIINTIISVNESSPRIRNNEGNTPLHLACINQCTIAVQNLLTTRKCGLYMTNDALCTPFQCAKIRNNQVIMLLLIKEMYVIRDEHGNSPLHLTCQRRDCQLAKFIIEEKFNVSVRNDHGDTPLHLACRNGHTDLVHILIHAKSDLEAKNKNGNTPLNVACMGASLPVVKALVEINCDIMNKNNDGDLCLHHVCRMGCLPIVKLIIHNCSKHLIKEPNKRGETPLHESFQHNHLMVASFLIKKLARREGVYVLSAVSLLDEVKKLVKEGCDPSQLLRIYDHQQTFLHMACKRPGDLEAVQLLTRSIHCNADLFDAYSWTPLHYACVNGHVKIVNHLVSKAGSDPKKSTPEGYTPLQLIAAHSICLEGNKLKIVKFLTQEVKCDPNDTIYNGDTLLNHLLKAKKVEFNFSVINYLISTFPSGLSSRSDRGNTALHIACDKGTSNVFVVKQIALIGGQYACEKNDKQQTPLHLACCNGEHAIAMILLNGNRALYETDKLGHLPLVTAFNSGHSNIASMIVSHMYKNRDKNGNTPLHLACLISNVSLVKFISKKNIDANAVNSSGDTSLHIACRTGNSELIKMVLDLNCDAMIIINKDKDTPIHITCRLGNPLLLNMLKRTDLFSVTRTEFRSLIHVASQFDHTSIVMLLLDMGVDANVRNESGDTPLHVACRAGHVSTCTVLLDNKCQIDPLNENGDSPLHFACHSGDIQIVEMLLNNGCELNTRNSDGDTPLLIASKYCDVDIITRMLKEKQIKADITNNTGNNMLHVLCRLGFCAPQIIQYTLETTHIDPNIVNLAGETPIQLTSNPHIIQELIRYGANPETVYTSSVQLDTKHPPQPLVKVFVVGNPSVGKSTLTAALQRELSRLVKVFTPAKKVSGVDEKTAGIIPYDFESKKYGLVTMFDFAGHREFYSSHAALLQTSIESAPPIILLVVDLRESKDIMEQNIWYWLSFLENQCPSQSRKPHVIIVGSHADILKSQGKSIKEKEEVVQGLRHFESMSIVGFVALDCQYSESSSMTKLREYLTSSCKSLRITSNIKFNAHCFLVYLIDKFKELRAVTIAQILQRIGDEKQAVTVESPLFFLPQNLVILFKLCNELNNRGHILLLRNENDPLMSWVVLDKESLLSDVIGTIFAPKGLKQYCNLASNTGVVPLSKLSTKFANYDPIMLVGFLTHLEFCHEISDREVLQLIGKHTTEFDDAIEGSEINDRYLFFPALVKVEAPDYVKHSKSKECYAHHCGWVLKCSKTEHFYTSRLLEVLLLRLMFSYALESVKVSDAESPILQRNCSVWKNGVLWGNNKGIETIVEVLPNNKSIVVLIRCLDEKHILPYLQLRSCVIQKILAAVSDLCSKVSITEYFIDPSQALSYPVHATKLYCVNEISKQIARFAVSSSTYIVAESGETISIKALLTFEPYAVLDKQIISKLFGKEDTLNEYIHDHKLSSIHHAISNCDTESCVIFGNIFDESSRASRNPAQLLQVLKLWRSSCAGTYNCLHQKLDQYSIIGGRNLLV